MATDLGHVKSPASRHEAFVETQLRRVRNRIRLYDTATALLGFLFLTLSWVLVVVLWDRLLGMAPGTRLLIWAAYAGVAFLYLGVTIVRPLLRPINPYFAARQVEQLLPDAKNSVINWLDLRQSKLPPAIHQSLGYRAARELTGFDIDRTLSPRQTVVLGILTILAGIALGVSLSVFRPTTIDLLEPTDAERGDHNITVPMHQSVLFRVRVGGRVPSPGNPERALKLLFRYHDDEPYQEQFLDRGDSDRDWQTQLPPRMIHSDLYYKVTGGYAETPEYQVRVQPPPLLSGQYDVAFRPPYLGSKPEAEVGRTHANLKAVQGTQVTLVAHTNRAVRQGYLDCASGERLPELLPRSDPQSMTFGFVLDRDPASGGPVFVSGKRRVPLEREGAFGRYRIRFEAADGQGNLDPVPYTVEVTTDQPPAVVLEKPAVTKLPANGVLPLKGHVTDDHGLTHIALQRVVSDGKGSRSLPPVAYREGKLRLADESYLRDVEYRDGLDLGKLGEGTGSVRLQPGMDVEFWLEATDDYTYPRPHVAASEHYHIQIEGTEADRAKLAAQRQQLERDRKAQEKALDHQLAEENRQRQGEDPKPGDKDQQQKDEQLKKEIDRLKEAMKQVEKEQGGKGDGPPKPEKSAGNGSDKKPDDKDKPDPGKQGPSDQSPDAKNPSPPQPQSKPSEKPNDQGNNQKGDKPDPEGKGPPKPDAQPDTGTPKPDAKDGQGNRDGQGDKKRDGNKDSKDVANPMGKGKPKGQNDPGKPGPGKADPSKGAPQGPGKADKKPGDDGKGDQGKPQAPAKGQQENQNDGKAPKGAGEGKVKSDTAPSEGSNGGKGEEKPTKQKPKGDQAAERTGKGPGGEPTGKHADPKDMSVPEVMELAKDLKSPDAAKRENAARKLTETADDGRDPAARQAAEDALKKAGLGKEAPAGKGTNPDEKKGQDGKRGDGGKGQEPGPGNGSSGPGAGKQQGPDGKPTEGKGQGHGGAGQGGKGKQPGGSGKGDASGDGKGEGGQASKGSGKGQGGAGGQGGGGFGSQGAGGGEKKPDAPGGNAGGGQREGAAGAGSGSAEAGMAPDERYRKIAGDLKLEDFRKQVTDRVLQKAGMTREQLEQVLRDLEQIRRPAPPPSNLDARPPAPREPGGAVLPSQGARRVDATVPGSGKAQRGGRAQSPPDLLEAQKDFSEKLRQLKKSPSR